MLAWLQLLVLQLWGHTWYSKESPKACGTRLNRRAILNLINSLFTFICPLANTRCQSVQFILWFRHNFPQRGAWNYKKKKRAITLCGSKEVLDAPAQFSPRSNTGFAATSSGQTSLKNAESSMCGARTVTGLCSASEPPTERMTF